MKVCINIGRLMLHTTYTKSHPKIIKTANFNRKSFTDDWVKILSFGKYGLYWKVK